MFIRIKQAYIFVKNNGMQAKRIVIVHLLNLRRFGENASFKKI